MITLGLDSLHLRQRKYLYARVRDYISLTARTRKRPERRGVVPLDEDHEGGQGQWVYDTVCGLSEIKRPIGSRLIRSPY